MVEGQKKEKQDPDKVWKCSACGAEFRPSPPDYSCPTCGSNATVSLDYRDKLENRQRRDIEERQCKHELNVPEKRCPECGTTMKVGYLVERDPIIEAIVLGREIYWSPDRSSETALNAYVCPSCGRVSLYAKLETSKSPILNASKRKAPV